ncbi:MAG: NAD(P)/FAD-dependent oxidoreductase, partial [Halobaculum sp.]
AELVWISDTDYHLVLHEAHRCIRNPSVESKIAIPIDEIKRPDTQFRKGQVTAVDTAEKRVALADGDDQPYDYLLLAVGTQTAFYGIEGLADNALTLKSLDDVREIHRAVTEAADAADADDPARIVVGGAGLSGIQTAGELAELRDDEGYAMQIQLVEGLDDVLPGQDPELQGRLRRQLEEAGVEILTGEFISEVDEETVYVGDEDGRELAYDVVIWTGGITGRDEVAGVDVEKDERSNRVHAGATFETSADGVFAIGDTALVDQGDEEVAPPTAQAAWQAAEVAGENLARACRGAPLKSWRHEDKGTLVSVGEDAVAHDVVGVPIRTFGGLPARFLKKAVAARWIATVASPGRAVTAWADM